MSDFIYPPNFTEEVNRKTSQEKPIVIQNVQDLELSMYRLGEIFQQAFPKATLSQTLEIQDHSEDIKTKYLVYTFNHIPAVSHTMFENVRQVIGTGCSHFINMGDDKFFQIVYKDHALGIMIGLRNFSSNLQRTHGWGENPRKNQRGGGGGHHQEKEGCTGCILVSTCVFVGFLAVIVAAIIGVWWIRKESGTTYPQFWEDQRTTKTPPPPEDRNDDGGSGTYPENGPELKAHFYRDSPNSQQPPPSPQTQQTQRPRGKQSA